MRVEHGGEYASSLPRGAPTHPVWYYNLTANPDSVTIQDGPTPFAVSVREIEATSAQSGGARGRGLPALRAVPVEDRAAHPVFLATRSPETATSRREGHASPRALVF